MSKKHDYQSKFIIEAKLDAKHSFCGFENSGTEITLRMPLLLRIKSKFIEEQKISALSLLLVKDGICVAEMECMDCCQSPAGVFTIGTTVDPSISFSPGATKTLRYDFFLKKTANTPCFQQVVLRYRHGQTFHYFLLGSCSGDWSGGSFACRDVFTALSEFTFSNPVMSEEKAAYLTLVQEPISRMSTTSAIFKGFSAAIVAGISSLTYQGISTIVLTLSFIPILVFTALDIYYLRLERGFRHLYKKILTGRRPVDFVINPHPPKWELKEAQMCFLQVALSPSILPFYTLMIAILAVVVILEYTGII